jgi:hypothetical protein
MSQYKQLIYVVLTLLTFAFMFRWDIEPSSGTDQNARIHYKLDRWTGTSYTCIDFTCRENN